MDGILSSIAVAALLGQRLHAAAMSRTRCPMFEGTLYDLETASRIDGEIADVLGDRERDAYG